MFPSRQLILLWSIFALLGSIPASADERYVLKVPGRNDLTSTASRTAQQLSITDSQNQTFIYQRVPQLDSRDGTYLGYYSRAAGQALRWPADGKGSMLIGDAGGQNWRQSRQQILSRDPQAGRGNIPNSVAPPREYVTRRPVLPAQAPFGTALQSNRPQRGRTTPPHVAYTRSGPQSLSVGMIDQQGGLQLYRGWRDKWQPFEIANANAVRSANLLPGAPLQLVANANRSLPSAYTVNSQGRLIEIADGGQVRLVSNEIPFTPGSDFRVEAGGQGSHGFAVDARGRLLDLDLTTGQPRWIDAAQSQFQPGTPISFVTRRSAGGRRVDLFLVDQQGQLLNYALTGGQWQPPRRLARGFPPAAPLTATTRQLGDGVQVRLAGVDARGRLQTLGQSVAGWQTLPVRNAALAPGSPVAFSSVGSQLSLSGIGPGGVWNHWAFQSGGWNQVIVNRGFPAGGPIVADPLSQSVFSVDAAGRLVAGGFWNDGWQLHLLVPGYELAPRIVERQVTPQQPLNPAQVIFDNPSQEELVVQVIDQVRGVGPIQVNIPPGGSVTQNIPRDSGGILQETFLVPDPLTGGFVEQVETYTLPPQPGPTVVVWAKRVTYSYVDPKGISPVPDFDLKNNVSLGVFELPPGELLRDGYRFNVFAEAVGRGNPGGAQFFGMPIPDGDVGVPLYRDHPPQNTPRPTAPPSESGSDSINRVIPPLPDNGGRTPERPNAPQPGAVLPPLPNE